MAARSRGLAHGTLGSSPQAEPYGRDDLESDRCLLTWVAPRTRPHAASPTRAVATALRCRVERESPYAATQRRTLLRRALVTARRAVRTARKFQNDLPHALREYALLLSMQGKRRQADRYFDESLTVAKRQGAQHAFIQTLQAQDRVARDHGISNVEFEVCDVAELGVVERFDLVTAFDAIHDQARPVEVLAGIARALRPEGVFLMQEIAGTSHVERDALHPVGTFLYTVSCMHCMTVSLASGGAGLGAMWGAETATRMLDEAGFDVSSPTTTGVLKLLQLIESKIE